MKLLLTSAGLSNPSIIKALFSLTKKKPSMSTVAFIPTASNVETGDKGWLIKDLANFKAIGFKTVSIVDISAVDKSIWLPQLEAADVLFFEGGSTFHLMRWIKKSGLDKLLPGLLKTRVFVGASAGSMVLSKDVSLRMAQEFYGEDMDESKDMKALNLVDFYFVPHLNAKSFPSCRKPAIKECVESMGATIYALDDHSALKVIDKQVEIISEGKYVVFEGK